MIPSFLNNLKTKELIFSDDTEDKIIRFKEILEFEGQSFLTFSRLDFSIFRDFKFFFKKFGSLYLSALLDYLYEIMYYVDEDIISNKIFDYKVWFKRTKSKVMKFNKMQLNEELNALHELRNENEYNIFKPIQSRLKKDIDEYIKKETPIDIKNFIDLHDFIYSGKRYYHYDYGFSLERLNILPNIQDELLSYIRLLDGKPLDEFKPFNKITLADYLGYIKINSSFNDNNLLYFEIMDLNIKNLLFIELIYYLINKKKIGECAYCGKTIIIKSKQLNFYNKEKPIYCGGDCQKMAKNKRGNEKKRKKRLKRFNKKGNQ